MKGKAQLKSGSPLPQSRLFNGEGWSPLDLQSVRQQCKGVQRNHHWDRFDIPANAFYSSSPLPIQEIPHGRDYTGTERGQVLVIGYYGEISTRHYWVTKCKCGTFELISQKTLVKNPRNSSHCCALCRLLESRRYHQECCDLAEQHGLN